MENEEFLAMDREVYEHFQKITAGVKLGLEEHRKGCLRCQKNWELLNHHRNEDLMMLGYQTCREDMRLSQPLLEMQAAWSDLEIQALATAVYERTDPEKKRGLHLNDAVDMFTQLREMARRRLVTKMMQNAPEH